MNKSRRTELAQAINLLSGLTDQIEKIKSIVSQAAEEEREYYDNMPEGIQNGDKGSEADNVATQLEEVVQSIEEFDIDDLILKIDEARGQA